MRQNVTYFPNCCNKKQEVCLAYLLLLLQTILSLFAKSRKATVSFVMFVRLGVCPHGTTRLPLDGFFFTNYDT